MNNAISPRTILILAANPKDTDRLQLDKEVREIETRLRTNRERHHLELKQQWAVRIEDIRQAFLDLEPQIVHFSGHGAGTDGLIVENATRNSQFVPTDAWIKLFQFFQPKIECVLLNACYSDIQAEAISQSVPYVVGVSHAVGDRAAILFASGFYEALAAARSYEDAYQFGCVALATEGVPEHLNPTLKKNLSLLKTLPSNLHLLQPNPHSTAPTSRLNAWQQQRMTQEINQLQRQYDLLNEKLIRLQTAHTLETDPATRFKLEKQMEQAQAEVDRVIQKIEALENSL
ncbi:MAG: CHAT domain-containing protein [Oculatellaceae cyanobacterium Prado106]|jgi:hypothetical protein|nr:CHAT domain-containing protein [Oculatellaceae cyanobacterium Prado106]